jgi:hypothetical protein
MKLEFTGKRHIRRIVGEVEWSAKAGWVQEVPAELAAELLTSPEARFKVSDSDPSRDLKGITEDEIVALILAGIESVGALRELDDEGITRLSEETRISRKKISVWAEAHEME